MPNLIERAVRALPVSEQDTKKLLASMVEVMNREWRPVLSLLRDLINERHGRIVRLTEDYTCEVGDEDIRVDTSDGNVTVIIGREAPEMFTRYVSKASSDGNTVTISPGGVPIVPAGAVVLTTQETAAFRYDNETSQWRRLF